MYNDTHTLGYSTPLGKEEVKEFLEQRLKPGMKILDMGPGQGTYYNLLGPNYNWSGVEIWHPAVEALQDKYNMIYEMDIRDFVYIRHYDLVIFGDVLEHMTIEDAQKCIANAKENADSILIAFPYDLKQGAIYGNEAERHIQYTTTPELFDKYYPGFTRIYYTEEHQYGYYYWSKK